MMLIEHMSEFPHCPYCGDKMELQVEMPDGGGDYTVWYQCVVCNSTSPFVQIPKGNTRTQIEKKALSAALYRAVSGNDTLHASKKTESEKCTAFTLLPSGIILNITRIDGIIRSEAKDSPYAVFVGGSNEAFRIDCDDYKALLPELHLSPKEDGFYGNQDEN